MTDRWKLDHSFEVPSQPHDASEERVSRMLRSMISILEACVECGVKVERYEGNVALDPSMAYSSEISLAGHLATLDIGTEVLDGVIRRVDGLSWLEAICIEAGVIEASPPASES